MSIKITSPPAFGGGHFNEVPREVPAEVPVDASQLHDMPLF